ncbi:LOW QUALITY PROTEIN: hypothetical protein HZS_3669 [Henneguya salminicola]|nr:LOW QUALITY PROTEIN: hypothetical protein HZS_3669 [Henneguya salminicola]
MFSFTTMSQLEFAKEVDELRITVFSNYGIFVETVLNALEHSCYLSASALNRCNLSIFIINSFVLLLELAIKYCCKNTHEKILSQISAHSDTLVTEQSHYVFDNLKMTKIYRAFQLISDQPDVTQFYYAL